MRAHQILATACLAAGLGGAQPAAATDPYAFATLAAGSTTTCGVTTTGAAKCWGRSGEGQVGDDHRFHRYTPVGVKGLDTGVAHRGRPEFRLRAHDGRRR